MGQAIAKPRAAMPLYAGRGHEAPRAGTAVHRVELKGDIGEHGLRTSSVAFGRRGEDSRPSISRADSQRSDGRASSDRESFSGGEEPEPKQAEPKKDEVDLALNDDGMIPPAELLICIRTERPRSTIWRTG